MSRWWGRTVGVLIVGLAGSIVAGAFVADRAAVTVSIMAICFLLAAGALHLVDVLDGDAQ